jgi:hypothetical protein
MSMGQAAEVNEGIIKNTICKYMGWVVSELGNASRTHSTTTASMANIGSGHGEAYVSRTWTSKGRGCPLGVGCALGCW